MTVVATTTSVSTSAPVNEEQTITVTATGGTFTIAFGGEPTAAIAFDATSATIESALEALDEFGGPDVSVTGDGPHLVAFAAGYAGTNVPLLTIDDAEATGGSVVVVQTQAGAPRTSPQRIDTPETSGRNRGSEVWVRNDAGTNEVYLGGPDVTASTGLRVPHTTVFGPIKLGATEGLYAICSDGESTTVVTLESGD